MGQREYYGRYPCAEPSCREHANFVYGLRQDQAESARYYAKNPWRCSRHVKPNEVLALDNREIRVELTASRVRNKSYDHDVANYERLMASPAPAWSSDPPRKPDPSREYLDGLFWLGGGLSSGFTFGPGFKAFANDFPEGTKIVITATLEVPQ